MLTTCHFYHCLYHGHFQVKGITKDKHPVSGKSRKANNTIIPTTHSVLGTQKFKETDMALFLIGITEVRLIHKKKCRDNSSGASALKEIGFFIMKR